MQESVVRVDSLTQKYGKRTVISGLDLTLGPGVFGILGPNGAGKTTLLRTLATIVPPYSGVLEVAGYQVIIPPANACCGRPLYDWGMLARAKRLLVA